MRQDVELRFNAHLIKIFGSKPEILKFVQEHERKKLCIDNLCEQIQKIEKQKYSLTFDAATYAWLIKDYAKLFAKAAILHADEQNLSQAETQRRLAKLALEKDAEQHIKDLEKDAFNEADEFEKAAIQKERSEEEGRRIRNDAQQERLYKSGGLVDSTGRKLKK